jgi:hypothetical protein
MDSSESHRFQQAPQRGTRYADFPQFREEQVRFQAQA